MAATSGNARIRGIYDLSQVFRGNRTALVGGVGVVVERHEAVLRDNGFGACYSFLKAELRLLRHLGFYLTTLESGLLVQRLQQLPVKRILPYSFCCLYSINFSFSFVLFYISAPRTYVSTLKTYVPAPETYVLKPEIISVPLKLGRVKY